MTQTPQNATDTAPIDDFSQCHTGIFRKLEVLSSLPALLEPAARAREVAAESLEFFREAIFEHHLDEERELFPLTTAHAQAGDEADRIKEMVQRLTQEHRELELTWKRLESGLKQVSKGQASDIRVADIEALVTRYRGHAEFEEREFLPLAQKILARNSNVMAALGMSLHMRHRPMNVVPFI